MGTTDWLVLPLVCPLFIAVGTWSSYRIWVHGRDVSGPVPWVGENSAGFNAAQLPITIGFVLTWLALLAAPVWGRPVNPSIISIVLGSAGVLTMFLSFWLWVFLWPKFLLPPHLRSQDSTIKGMWRARQERRRNPPPNGGDHRRA